MLEGGRIIEVTGADGVRRALDGLGATVSDPPALDQVARALAGAVAAAAPRRTGRLASSVRPVRARGEAAAESTVEYAGVIDRGWPARNIAPADFTARGAAAVVDDAAQLIESALQTEIRKTGLT